MKTVSPLNSRFFGAFLLGSLMILIFHTPVQGGSKQTRILPDFSTLFSSLNLDAPGLEKVRKAAGNPEKGAALLLQYYRQRTSVKSFVNPSNRKSMLGKSASSGDLAMADNALKHLFMGQPAYPPFFCGEDINWGARPVPDNEWVWQLNRMYFWDAMAKSYWHTGDEKYAKEWAAQLVDWVRKNPRDEQHEYAWRSIEAGIRGHSWTTLFHYYLDSPSFTPEVLVAFLNSCRDHAEYLMTVYRSKSNWGLMEAEGLAFIAITFPEFRDAATWRNEAFRRLNNEIELQVYPDGQQRELAMGYHLGCIEWFMRTWELARMNGIDNIFPETYLQKVEKMCEVPMKICHPDGTNAQFGDSWAGNPGQHATKFLEWSKKFNRQDFLFLATGGKEGTKPAETAYALKESGLYSLRSGWARDAVCLVLKCGPDGGGHCQPDNGTFELSAGGRNLMPDAGSYIYSGDPEGRNWFRQTKIHQTLTLNGGNSRYAPKLLLWKPGGKIDILVVENQSYKDLAHRRSVFFVDKRYFILVDEAIGSATGAVDLHFQLAPCEPVFDAGLMTAATGFSEGWNVLVQPLRFPGMTMEQEEGQVSFRYTKKEPRPAFRYHFDKQEGPGPVRFITVVAPYRGTKPDVTVSLKGNPQQGSPNLELEIREGSTSQTIGYTLE